MLGKIEGRRRRGQQENVMVEWHHRLNGHEFEQTWEDGEGQGSLVCCSPWGCRESDMTQQLNNNKKFNYSEKRLGHCRGKCLQTFKSHLSINQSRNSEEKPSESEGEGKEIINNILEIKHHEFNGFQGNMRIILRSYEEGKLLNAYIFVIPTLR